MSRDLGGSKNIQAHLVALDDNPERRVSQSDAVAHGGAEHRDIRVAPNVGVLVHLERARFRSMPEPLLHEPAHDLVSARDIDDARREPVAAGDDLRARDRAERDCLGVAGLEANCGAGRDV